MKLRACSPLVLCLATFFVGFIQFGTPLSAQDRPVQAQGSAKPGFSFAPYVGRLAEYEVTNTERNAAKSVEMSIQRYFLLAANKAICIEQFSRRHITYLARMGPNKGKNIQKRGRTVRPDLIHVIQEPTHWPQPWKMGLYTKVPVSSVQELSFFQGIVIREASAFLRRPEVLPATKAKLRNYLHLFMTVSVRRSQLSASRLRR